MTELGRLERVDLRAIWVSEPGGFTPWLANSENLSLLGRTIGIELEFEGQERNVGPFRADILCKDTDDGSWVLIENQLERTDHLHLGQLLTYAAGLDAVTVVWIAGRFIDEHRAALDWLNRITADNFRFFGLEIELWRIGSSPPAPKFNVVAKPNQWAQSVGEVARSISNGASDERKEQYVAYWTALGDLLAIRHSTVRLKRAQPQYWMDLGLGCSGFTLSALAGFRDKWIAVAVFAIDDARKTFFHLLYRDRDDIERELGYALSWQETPGFKRSRIEIRKDGVDPLNEADWPAQHIWLAEKLEQLDRVFRPRVRALSSAKWAIEDEASEASGGLMNEYAGLKAL